MGEPMRKEEVDCRMKTVSVEELQLNCLEIIDLVEKKGYTYVITKNGRPFVMMKPVAAESEAPGKRD